MTQASTIGKALGARATHIEYHVPTALAGAFHGYWLVCCAILLFFSSCELHWIVITLIGVGACWNMVLCDGSFAAVHSSCVLRWGVQIVLSGGAQSRSTRSGAPMCALLACCGLRDDVVIILHILECHRLLVYAVAMLVLHSLASSTGCCLPSRSRRWRHDLILLRFLILLLLIHRPSCLRYGVNNQVHHITLMVHLVQCSFCTWVVWSDRRMWFKSSYWFRLCLLEILSKLAFQIGLLWILLLSIHVLLILL